MTTLTSNSVRPILLVEDNPEDYATTVRALERVGVHNPVYRCEDGDDALDYLYQRGAYDRQSAPMPGVILMDLNLPGTDGREVLAEIKADIRLKWVPVIVLTTSTDERDVRACYEAGANSYVRKPVNLSGFMDAVARLKDFWFDVAILPRAQEN